MGFRLLLYGDLHLGPSSREQPFERPDLSGTGVDAVVSLGDVVDDNTDRSGRSARRHERRARAFFEHLDDAGVPVVAVPGDRDPLPTTGRVTQGLDNVVVAHGDVLRAADLPGDPDLAGAALVGLGCTDDDPGMALPYMEFGTIDPRTTTNAATVGYVADDAADQVETAVSGFLSREHGVDGVADEMGVQGSARERLAGHLDALREEFLERRALLATGDPTVLLSHVPPFNTAFDYRESFDDVDARLHRGSISLKMAVAAAPPTATLAGHVHERGRDTLSTTGGPRPAYNAGSPGVAVVDVDPESGAVDVHPDPF